MKNRAKPPVIRETETAVVVGSGDRLAPEDLCGLYNHGKIATRRQRTTGIVSENTMKFFLRLEAQTHPANTELGPGISMAEVHG
jgi:hypothetical protein